ncbi:hypothetical protein MRB53_028393 [Persea americana]|uniref:Uncharacterized protein n=1 Tax=Persea americana TaxID=3435 RepID=A0ACC2KFF6_PERAE|nr:hypothetical protein MRB53_028393 [Persea americana]
MNPTPLMACNSGAPLLRRDRVAVIAAFFFDGAQLANPDPLQLSSSMGHNWQTLILCYFLQPNRLQRLATTVARPIFPNEPYKERRLFSVVPMKLR